MKQWKFIPFLFIKVIVKKLFTRSESRTVPKRGANSGPLNYRSHAICSLSHRTSTQYKIYQKFYSKLFHKTLDLKFFQSIRMVNTDF